MKRRERTALSAAAQHELEAIDAALDGENVPAEHARLAELATALRELRALPREEFADALDAQAARSLRRGSARADDAARAIASTSSRRSSFGRARSLLLRPASGLALAAIVALAVAVPLLTSAPHHPAARPLRAGPQFGPAFAGPAPPAGPARGQLRGGAAEAASAAPTVEKKAAVSGSGTINSGTRLIERTATLDVGVAPSAIESSAERVFTLVSASGGYVRQSSVSSGEPGRGVEPVQGEEGQRGGASFDIRVPSANLSSAIAALAHVGHVRSETNTTNDVTDEHSSLDRSLAAAQAERSSLLAQLRKATGEPEVALYKTRLRAVDEHIAQLQSQLRGLNQRVTYTSLSLSLTPESSSGGAGVGGLTPGGAAHDAATILDAALAVLVIAAAALLPVAAIVIAAWAAFALTRRRLREQALDAS